MHPLQENDEIFQRYYAFGERSFGVRAILSNAAPDTAQGLYFLHAPSPVRYQLAHTILGRAVSDLAFRRVGRGAV